MSEIFGVEVAFVTNILTSLRCVFVWFILHSFVGIISEFLNNKHLFCFYYFYYFHLAVSGIIC